MAIPGSTDEVKQIHELDDVASAAALAESWTVVDVPNPAYNPANPGTTRPFLTRRTRPATGALPGPNDRLDLRKHVRCYSTDTAPHYRPGDSTLTGLPVAGLCLFTVCSVEFGPDGYGREYRLLYDPTGNLQVFVDGRGTGSKLPARWVLVGSVKESTSGIEPFSPLADFYPAGKQLTHTPAGRSLVGLFQVLADLMATPGNPIPAPAGLPADAGRYKELPLATPPQAPARYVSRPVLLDLLSEDGVVPGPLYRIIGRSDGFDVLVHGLTVNAVSEARAYSVPAGADVPVVVGSYSVANDYFTPGSGAMLYQATDAVLLRQLIAEEELLAPRWYDIARGAAGNVLVQAVGSTGRELHPVALWRNPVTGLLERVGYDVAEDEVLPESTGPIVLERTVAQIEDMIAEGAIAPFQYYYVTPFQDRITVQFSTDGASQGEYWNPAAEETGKVIFSGNGTVTLFPYQTGPLGPGGGDVTKAYVDAADSAIRADLLTVENDLTDLENEALRLDNDKAEKTDLRLNLFAPGAGSAALKANVLNEATGGASRALGVQGIASAEHSVTFGYLNEAKNNWATAIGVFTTAKGVGSYASGIGRDLANYSPVGDPALREQNGTLLAGGYGSFIHSFNNGSQVGGHGALATYCAVLGGANANVAAGAIGTVLTASNATKVPDTLTISGAAVPFTYKHAAPEFVAMQPGLGYVLRSPNGDYHRIAVSDAGGLLVDGAGVGGPGNPGTSYTDEQAQDAAAALLLAGTHTGISFAYNDATNKLNVTVAPAPDTTTCVVKVGSPANVSGTGAQLYGNAYQAVPLTEVVEDAGGNWDAATYEYTVPKNGLYLVLTEAFRLDGSSAPGLDFYFGAHTETAFGDQLLWQKTRGALNGAQHFWQPRLTAGQKVRLVTFLNGFDAKVQARMAIRFIST